MHNECDVHLQTMFGNNSCHVLYAFWKSCFLLFDYKHWGKPTISRVGCLSSSVEKQGKTTLPQSIKTQPKLLPDYSSTFGLSLVFTGFICAPKQLINKASQKRHILPIVFLKLYKAFSCQNHIQTVAGLYKKRFFYF